MKIYTKTGDEGFTGLFGGARVSKACSRVDAYGTVDELNSNLGLVASRIEDETLITRLHAVQSELFTIGAELATVNGKEEKLGLDLVGDDSVALLESYIDESESELEPLKSFVLPGGTAAAAHLHVARTVCRRAERNIVSLSANEPVRPELIRYLNRLSDLLFSWGRLANKRAGVSDVPWVGRG